MLRCYRKIHGVAVPRFKIGDRVQVVGDVTRLYACVVGVIVPGASHTASVLNQYTVRLADGPKSADYSVDEDVLCRIDAIAARWHAGTLRPPKPREAHPQA